MTRLVRLLCLVALLAFAAVPASALAAQPRASFNDLEDEVMCDVCGVPLNIAESPRAEQQRQEIKAMIAKGMTKKQIKAQLVAQYGPSILATPEDHGFQLAAYLVPIAAVLAALAALAIALPRWRRRRVAGDDSDDDDGAPPMNAADARRLDEDLARFGA
jgi:cytochrome c-type biogenesis protein CcmH/NrfF